MVSPMLTVIENPPDGVNTGDEVRIVTPSMGGASVGGSKGSDATDKD